MLRYKTETRPGLVALCDIRPGNGAVYSYNPGAHMGLIQTRKLHLNLVGSFETYNTVQVPFIS